MKNANSVSTRASFLTIEGKKNILSKKKIKQKGKQKNQEKESKEERKHFK